MLALCYHRHIMHVSALPPELKAKRRKHQIRAYKRTHIANLLELQELILSKAKADDLAARDLSSLALAWERLEERLRVLRGRPLPGSLKPEPRPAKAKQAAWAPPTEVIEPPAA